MAHSHVGELAAMGTAILWTLSAVFFIAAGKRTGSLAVSFLRLVIACGPLMAYAPLAGGRCLPTDADARTWFLLGISGFLGFFLCDVCLFKAMLLIGARRALLVYSLTPPITALVSPVIVIGDALTLRHWMAMGITLAGVAWVVLERPDLGDPFHAPHHRWRGVALALFAAATSAIGMVFSRDVMRTYDDAAGATLIRVLAALPAYVILITAWRRWPAMLAALRDPLALTALAIGSVIGPFAGAVLIMVAFKYSTAGVVTTITATMPVLILPLSILVYHERIGLRAIGGALLAVAGVALLML